MTEPEEAEFLYPYETALHEAFPRLHDIQSEWLSALDSLTALDRKTHELVRLALAASRLNRSGVERHARFATEVGATWPEICEAIVLTSPAYGMLPVATAIPIAKQAFESTTPSEVD
jgi:alkylhydroperoxidase/carboxymuconolactone decarboxylase family protein YurZ